MADALDRITQDEERAYQLMAIAMQLLDVPEAAQPTLAMHVIQMARVLRGVPP